MKKALAKFFIRLTGWTVDVNITPELKHSVMVAAPHTSNWDFPYTIFTFWYMGVDVRYFIKDSYTKGPMGWLFNWTGAIGVDRSKKGNKLTDYAIELLKENKELVILIPAEGTRKAVHKWRTGFYRIAMEAKVPVSLGYMDYKKKIAGVADVFWLSGDFEKDMTHIQETYRHFHPKHPEGYNPEIF